MPQITITPNVPPEYAARAQEHYFAWLLESDTMGKREVYRSPDSTKAFCLKKNGEIRFGPRMYSGKVRRLKRDGRLGRTLKLFWFRRLLSPGAFGYWCCNWSGSPWSPNSRYLAINEFTGQEHEGARLILVDFIGGRKRKLTGAGSISMHHMWSSAGDYLFRDMTSWYLYTHADKAVRKFCTGSTMPRHCYFDHQGKTLILLDEELMISVLDCKSLTPLVKASVADRLTGDQKINFSLPDPFENQILLAVDAKFGETVQCDTWMAVRVED